MARWTVLSGVALGYPYTRIPNQYRTWQVFEFTMVIYRIPAAKASICRSTQAAAVSGEFDVCRLGYRNLTSVKPGSS